MPVWIFARLTLREASRSRLLLLAGGLTVVFLALVAWGGHSVASVTSLSPQIAGAGIEVLAFYVGTFMLALLAVFVPGASTHQEGESGLLQAMLTRPVSRLDFLAGKWLGSALLLAGYITIFSAGLDAAIELSTGYLPPHPVQAGALLALEALILLTLRLLFGTFLGNMASGIVPLMLYGLAWMGGLVESIGQVTHIQSMINSGIISSLLVPTDIIWRGASYLLEPEGAGALAGAVGRENPLVGTSPIAGPMLVWACLYVLVMFVLGARLFNQRDI